MVAVKQYESKSSRALSNSAELGVIWKVGRAPADKNALILLRVFVTSSDPVRSSQSAPANAVNISYPRFHTLCLLFILTTHGPVYCKLAPVD